MIRIFLASQCIVAALAALSAGATDPQIGKSSRYCNPLPMVTAPGGNASGDVTVIREKGKYYMYCTGGGAWISDDLLNWSYQRVANVPVAPHVVKYNGSFYLCGNSGPLFKADNPLGPFTSVGEWKTPPGPAGEWRGPFDMDIYIDDDNKPYLYFPGRGADGIFVVPLDPSDLTRFAGPVKQLFAFNRDHVWERYGEMNALSRASSEQPGRDAAYAVDNSSGTWWEPAATDAQPTLTIELSPATRFDAVQLFTIDSVRLLFHSGRGFGSGRGGPGVAGTPPGGPTPTGRTPATAAVSDRLAVNAYQYKIEVSSDGQSYAMALDQTGNATSRNVIYEEIPPAKCRFVRLTLRNWPRATPLGIIEFTVFGKSAGTAPAAQPIPAAR